MSQSNEWPEITERTPLDQLEEFYSSLPSCYKIHSQVGDTFEAMTLFGYFKGKVTDMTDNERHIQDGDKILVQRWIHNKYWMDSYAFARPPKKENT